MAMHALTSMLGKAAQTSGMQGSSLDEKRKKGYSPSQCWPMQCHMP
jgi:hypothetical protein